jgi:hypothetical protein
MRRCVKCAHVVEGESPLCAACQRPGTGAPGSDAAASEPGPPAGVLPPLAELPQVEIPMPAAGLKAWHVGAAFASAGAAAALAFLLLGTGGANGRSMASTDQASVLGMAGTGKPPATAAVDRWTDENSARWVSNHRRSIAFELPAENTTSAGLARVRPVLVVRCLANTTEVFVYTQWPAAMEPKDDRRTTHVSFDNDAESTERWLTSADHDALFAPDPVMFARRLARGQTLRFGFTPHNGRRETVEFHVNGFSDHVGSVARLCKWK